MSQNVTVAGVSYTIPDQYETEAGYFLGTFLAALAARSANAQVTTGSAATATLTAAQSGSTIVNTYAGGTAAYTLPTAPPVNTVFRLVTGGAHAFTVAPGGSDLIYFNGVSQTTKTLITSPATQGGTVDLVYTATNAWTVINSQGTFTSN